MGTLLNKHKSSFVYSNSNIFDIIQSRVNCGHNGATVFVPHVCNNIDLFGAGFAAQVAERYPIVKQNYHLLGKNFLRANLGHCQFIDVYHNKDYGHRLIFVNMIAQNATKSPNNIRPLNYGALCKAMLGVSSYIRMNTEFLQKNQTVEIHAPKFGSGLAGGNWNFISDLIDDIWSKFFVTVYNYNPKK
jgi:hypothetical protein